MPRSTSLDDALITDQLSQRPSRPPDYEGEAKALAALALAMAAAPDTVLQELVDQVLRLCRADSAGVSLRSSDEGDDFRWAAVGGAWASHAGSSLARDAAPCAVVLSRDRPLLFEDLGRFFRGGPPVSPAPAETVLVPFNAGGVPIGTVWAVCHSPDRKFDGEDVRLLTSLSRFASAAHQMTAALREAATARASVEVDSQAYAQSIVDTMRDPLLILDSDLRIISASREFYRSFRVSPEETEGKPVYELGNRQWDIPRLRTLLEEILPRETTFRDFEVEHTFEHIGRKIMLLNARAVHRQGDGSEQILLVIEDVTERRDAEEARREAEARFTEMVKNVRDHSIFLTDPEGIITSWNLAAERIVGYTEADAVGRHFSLIFLPEDIQNGVPEQELRQALEKGRAEDERWHVRKGGEPFWALGIVTPLHEPGGRLSGFSKILRDMTDRKRAEAALGESESRLKVALAAARMGIWTLDLEAGIQMRDANLNRLLGLEPVETTQPVEEFFALVHPVERSAVREAFAASSREGRPLNIEFRIVRPDDAVRWLRDQGDVIGDAATGTRHMTGACVDATDLKEAEQALRDAHDRLEERVAERTADLEAEVKRRKELTRRLATAQEDERRRVSRDLHDSIEQLLAGLSMAFKAVENDGALSPPVVGKLADAQAIVDTLGKEIHGLAVRLRPTSLDDIGLESALGQLVAEWSSRTGVRADFHSEGLGQDRLTPEIETTLYRVVQEALTNVAKHARAGVVSVVVSRPDGYVTAVIEDDGVGFDPDASPRGRLGLVGMSERVTLVGGELKVESEPGSGATFYVRIPIPAGKGGGS